MKKSLLTFLFLLINIVALFAQGGVPCDPDDTSCPIDSWVVAFGACAMMLTMVHLHRKVKTAAQTTQ